MGKHLAIERCKALGFESGIFHVECKYTSTGPQLIEVNARMGGGPVREVNRLVWGVDLVEEAMFVALGIPAWPPAPTEPNICVSYVFVNAQRSGHIVSTKCIEDLQMRENVIWSTPLVKSGDAVVCANDGLPTWLCLLVTTGQTPKDTLDYVLRLEAELPVKIE